MLYQKNHLFFSLCWICVFCFDLSKESRTELMITQFQNKLNTFESEIDLLQYDMLDLQGKVQTLNKTCICQNTENLGIYGSITEPGLETSRRDDMHMAITGNINDDLEQCKADFKAEIAKVSDNVKKVFRDEKKHLRHHLKQIEGTVKDIQIRHSDFLQETQSRVEAHETKLKLNQELIVSDIEEIVNKTVETFTSEMEAAKRDYKQEITNMYNLWNETEEKNTKIETEHEERIKKLETKIDKTAAVESDIEHLKKVINVLISTIFITGREDWVTDAQTKAQFLYVSEKLSWNDAKTYCGKLFGYLVEPNTNEKETFVQNFVKGKSMEFVAYWLGASDIRAEGDWRWVNSNRLVSEGFFKWNAGEPNDAQGKEDCAIAFYFGSIYTWNDVPCGEKFPFICERSMHFLSP